jgi:hypothetical protein
MISGSGLPAHTLERLYEIPQRLAERWLPRQGLLPTKTTPLAVGPLPPGRIPEPPQADFTSHRERDGVSSSYLRAIFFHALKSLQTPSAPSAP